MELKFKRRMTKDKLIAYNKCKYVKTDLNHVSMFEYLRTPEGETVLTVDDIKNNLGGSKWVI